MKLHRHQNKNLSHTAGMPFSHKTEIWNFPNIMYLGKPTFPMLSISYYNESTSCQFIDWQPIFTAIPNLLGIGDICYSSLKCRSNRYTTPKHDVSSTCPSSLIYFHVKSFFYSYSSPKTKELHTSIKRNACTLCWPCTSWKIKLPFACFNCIVTCTTIYH